MDAVAAMRVIDIFHPERLSDSLNRIQARLQESVICCFW